MDGVSRGLCRHGPGTSSVSLIVVSVVCVRFLSASVFDVMACVFVCLDACLPFGALEFLCLFLTSLSVLLLLDLLCVSVSILCGLLISSLVCLCLRFCLLDGRTGSLGTPRAWRARFLGGRVLPSCLCAPCVHAASGAHRIFAHAVTWPPSPVLATRAGWPRERACAHQGSRQREPPDHWDASARGLRRPPGPRAKDSRHSRPSRPCPSSSAEPHNIHVRPSPSSSIPVRSS
jgi:hypothetical protein